MALNIDFRNNNQSDNIQFLELIKSTYLPIPQHVTLWWHMMKVKPERDLAFGLQKDPDFYMQRELYFIYKS